MRNRLPLLTALLAPILLAGGKPTTVQSIQTVVPNSGLYIRNSFDTDPTEYIGGFVMDPNVVPDESSATKLRCSQYVGYKEVGTGGATKTTYFSASAEAALSLGIPPVLGVKGNASQAVTLLVQYQETKKWQATVTDPTAFANCCASYPDQCRDRYIGDFIGGKGAVYYKLERKGSADVGVMATTFAARLQLSDGTEWGLANEFPNEVAFAFKLKDAPRSKASDMHDPVCDTEWERQAPPAGRGHWELAVSDVFEDEAGALENARDHAATGTAKWLSSSVNNKSQGGRVNSGGASMRSAIGSEAQWESSANAVINRLDQVCLRMEDGMTGDRRMYKAHALFLLPQEEVEAARTEAAAAAPALDATGAASPTPEGGTRGAP